MASKIADLNGKVVLVTGGAKGIGRGCVEIFAENGWKVALWDIDDTEGGNAEKTYADRVVYMHRDVTDEEQIKNGIAATVEKFGKLDCLVNNAGNQPSLHSIDEYTTDDFRKLLELNLVSCFAMCKYALPHLRQSKGNIVNVSSITVENGLPEAVIYGTSKAGITTMTRCLAIDEAKNGVRVNAIAPGAIRTPMSENLAVESGGMDVVFERFRHFNLLRRYGEPREMGKACLYLANDGTYCTGSILYATGGIEVGYGHKYC